jgi:hypothetical protein
MNLQERIEKGEEIELIMKVEKTGLNISEATNKDEDGTRSILRLRTDGAAEAVFLCEPAERVNSAQRHEISLGYDEVAEKVAKHFRDQQEMKTLLEAVYQDELSRLLTSDPEQGKRLERIGKFPAVVLAGDLMCVSNFLCDVVNGKKKPDGYIHFSMEERDARALWPAVNARAIAP